MASARSSAPNWNTGWVARSIWTYPTMWPIRVPEPFATYIPTIAKRTWWEVCRRRQTLPTPWATWCTNGPIASLWSQPSPPWSLSWLCLSSTGTYIVRRQITIMDNSTPLSCAQAMATNRRYFWNGRWAVCAIWISLLPIILRCPTSWARSLIATPSIRCLFPWAIPSLANHTVIRPNIATIACGCASKSCSDWLRHTQRKSIRLPRSIVIIPQQAFMSRSQWTWKEATPGNSESTTTKVLAHISGWWTNCRYRHHSRMASWRWWTTTTLILFLPWIIRKLLA